jgi:hypothetical protein
MAELDFSGYRSGAALAAGNVAKPRRLDFIVDFSDTDNQLAAATDSLNLCELPAGTVVMAGGIEQITDSDETTNTLTARVSTLALSGTLAGNAAAGVKTANATDAADQLPETLTAAADFNLLSATAIRLTGIVRAWIIVSEGNTPYGIPKLAARDQTTGLA